MEELIEKAKKGNKEAFTKLILEIRHDLYKIAKCRLHIEADIEDAVQETMIKAFKSIKKLNKNEMFKQWIISILINECNAVYKKNKRKEVPLEELEITDVYSANEEYRKLEDYDFYALLKCLKYDEKIVLVLFFVEDYSIKDISKVLKTNENTIKTWLKRGKEKIKQNYVKGDE